MPSSESLRNRTRPRNAYSLAIAAATLLFFAISMLWAMNLPHHDGPDELRHLNSIARLADDKGWPLPYEAPMLGSIMESRMQNGAQGGQGSLKPQIAPDDRAMFLGPTEFADRDRDNMVQHPPGYYGIAAFVAKALDVPAMRWDQAALVLRGASALIVAGAVPFIIGAVRWATGSRLVGVLGGIGVLAIPFFTTLAGYVSNDTLLITACSATLYFLFRAIRDPEAGEWVLPAAGAAFGAALFTKGLALMLAPTVVILALVAARRRSSTGAGTAIRVGIPAILAFAIGGWWWLRNLILLGKIQPSLAGRRERPEERIEDYDFWYFTGEFFSRVNRLFWSRDMLPSWVAVIALAGLLIAIGIGIGVRRTRLLLLASLLFPVLITLTVYQNAHGIYWDLGRPDRGAQGRYIFGAIVAIAVAVGAVWLVVLPRLGRVARRWAVVAGILAPVTITLTTMPFTIERRWLIFWQRRGAFQDDSMWVMDREWYMGVPLAVDVAAAVAALIAIVALVALALRLSADHADELPRPRVRPSARVPAAGR
ncbi:MAG: glycosyltransferase family 39 protein [Microbacteriaceae bacterium]|nr:glycosyltransferase family 39 protein [Microbacteriaceae bacterium]